MFETFAEKSEKLNKNIELNEKMQTKMIKSQRIYDLKNQKTKCQKIYQICVAYDDSLVFSGRISRYQYCIWHYSKDNQKLGEILIQNSPFSEFVMVSPTQVCALVPQKQTLYYWQLKKNDYIKLDCKIKDPQCSMGRLFYFSKTNLLSIADYGDITTNNMVLKYYQLPLTEQSEQIVEYNDNCETFKADFHLIGKGNDDSMIYWMKSTFFETIEFYYYEIGQQRKKISISLKPFIMQQMGAKKNQKFQLKVNVSAIWSMGQKIWFLSTHTNIPKLNRQYVNNFFVADLSKEIPSEMIRNVKFNFNNDTHHSIFSDQIGFGEFGMIQTHDFAAGKLIPSPAYFFSHKWEHIFEEEILSHTKDRKWTVCHYNEDILVEAYYPNADINDIKVIKRVVIYPYLACHILHGQLLHKIPQQLSAFLGENQLKDKLENLSLESDSENHLSKYQEYKYFTEEDIIAERKKYKKLQGDQLLKKIFNNLCEKQYFKSVM